MELQEALSQIGEIRANLARAETAASSRSLTVGGIGILACASGVVQSVWISQPMEQPLAVICMWINVALVSSAIVGAELTVRCVRAKSAIVRRATLQAVEQFAPCLIAGGCYTWAIAQYSPESVALLPGLWAITFGLGIFATSRNLPASTLPVASFFVASGTVVLVLGRADYALSPWTMVATFGVGHFLLAAAFYFGLEQQHGTG